MHPNRFYHHATIAFRPKALSCPERIGEKVLLRVNGRLTTNKVDVLLVDLPFNVKVENPHITLSTAEGVAPAESKTVLKDRVGHLIEFFQEPFFINARYGYFNGKDISYE